MKKTLKAALALIVCVITLSATMMMASALAAPTMKVKSVTYNSVTLYWTKVSGADGYQIARTTDGKNWTNLGTTTSTTYTDSKSLTTGKSYGYRIRSYDKGLLKTTYSSWTSMITAKPIPAKPTGFKVKAANNTAVQLTWNKVSGASGYTLYYLSGSAWKAYKSTTSNAIIVSGLTLGKTYSFRVLAYRTVSGKKVNGSASDTLKASPVLAATSKVVISAVSTTGMTIQWAGVAGAKGYEIYNHTTGKWTNTKTTKGIVLKGLEPGKKYSFKVRAYSGTIKGKESAVYTFQTTPDKAKNVKVTDFTDTTISFSWNAVPGATGYQPAVYDYATGKWTYLALTSGTSAKATGLSSSSDYAVNVRAYVTNSNVHNIGANTAGAWADYVKTKTGFGATKLTATKTSKTAITLKWNALKGATGYVIEKFDASYKAWVVYDFATASWKESDKLDNSSITKTTATSFVDNGMATRSDIYRVRGIDESGNIGTASNTATGHTSNVYINLTDKNYILRQFIRWPETAGASKYRVVARYPSSETVIEYAASKVKSPQYAGYCESYFYFAPNSVHSIMILAEDNKGQVLGTTFWFTFEIGAVPIVSSSDATYNYAVNSQLLYLARAINNTKAYTGTIKVKNDSEVSYTMNYLNFLGWELNSASAIEATFKLLAPGEEVPVSSSEKDSSEITFEGGKGITDEGKVIYLTSAVEPATASNKRAYLYNSQNPTAWKNGFSSVTTTKNSDGSISMKLELKQEVGNSNYHSGYMSTFNAKDFGAGEGFNMTDLKVGKSTITAVIGADGILKSYTAYSPYSSRFSASFVAEDDVKDQNVQAGDKISMAMGIEGSLSFNYTFTK